MVKSTENSSDRSGAKPINITSFKGNLNEEFSEKRAVEMAEN